MTTEGVLIVDFESHVNEDVTDSNLQSNIVEPSVTISDGEDKPSGEKEVTTEIKLEKEENEKDERLKRKKPFPPFTVLHPYGYRKWNLCARVEQKFNVQHYPSKKRMKLLLVDAEGTKLEASMYDGEVDRLQDIVEEGKVYSFTAVDIKNAPTQYKLVDSDIECLLTNETEIEEEDDDNNIPMLSFKLRTFDKLHAFEGNKRLLIGRLQHVKMIVSDTLATLDSDWQAASNNDTIIVATALLINCFKAPIIVEYFSILQSMKFKISRQEIASCNIGGANMVAVDLTGATRITVQELKQFSDYNINKCGFYEVVITISKIYYDKHNSLWYTGCGWCRTGLLEAPNSQYWCRKCAKLYSEGCLRYVFKMEIVDHTGCHDVTIFDEVGEKLLGCKANFLFELFKKDNSHVVIMERLRSITYNRYNMFVMVENNNGSQITRSRHEISVIYVTPLDPAKEAKYLLDVIDSST
ncbi:Replication protein A DNA-binding subunit B [Carex littledalei]|uniref:Replication protein A DNA-binding subunit B n=1 Tax=Carex littledalei TaxID=544730 RepID=A0A833RKX7_9POAL|nr:Replication protein A DNA-binding subunit B [Carex littledalei]